MLFFMRTLKSSVNHFYDIAVVYDGSLDSVKLYVDGVLEPLLRDHNPMGVNVDKNNFFIGNMLCILREFHG